MAGIKKEALDLMVETMHTMDEYFKLSKTDPIQENRDHFAKQFKKESVKYDAMVQMASLLTGMSEDDIWWEVHLQNS